MLGEDLLREHARRNGDVKMTQVNDHVYHFMGYGSSNACALVGDTSVIMVDTFSRPENAAAAMRELRQVTDKPVKTIIFTHRHPDHTGGSPYFEETVDEIIAFTPVKTPLRYYDRVAAGLNKRGMRQFGAGLTEEESISLGLGRVEDDAHKAPGPVLQPTTLYSAEERVKRTIDGLELELLRMPGETDDQISVWLPSDRVVCSGDNYYACWPNLYAIRGTNYRDISTWVDSLTRTLALDPIALLPGHTAPLFGTELIQEQVGTYRDAIAYVLDRTLACINDLKTVDEAVGEVKLPEKWRDLPYLGEFYGTVEWTVRGIYAGYVGWFDGDPTALCPAPESAYQAELLGLIGHDRVVERVRELMVRDEYQLALELLKMVGEPELTIACLKSRARQMTSANGRHYLLVCAKELEAARNDA